MTAVRERGTSWIDVATPEVFATGVHPAVGTTPVGPRDVELVVVIHEADGGVGQLGGCVARRARELVWTNDVTSCRCDTVRGGPVPGEVAVEEGVGETQPERRSQAKAVHPATTLDGR
ncbi:MAG: hypothetical protein K0V04_17360, partial [Deltaproteobacteria bacterium]|nr:hypothetical protein [Deltaproteobacteria bacterium]